MVNKNIRRTARGYNNKQSKQQSLPPFVWGAVGLIIGLTVTIVLQLLGVIKFNQTALEVNCSSNDNDQAVPVDIATEIEEETDNDTNHKPVFEFYERLPEMEVEVPETTINLRTQNLENFQYVLQVGSFKNAVDAEALKAQLAFNGVVAEVKPVTVEQHKWYRVSIGPFASKRKIESIQRKLHEQGIDSILLRQMIE